MANSADPDQLASSEANWSGSTVFVKQDVYLGSAWQGLREGQWKPNNNYYPIYGKDDLNGNSIYPKYWHREALANNEDPDQKMAPEQDQHCLSHSQQILDISTDTN